jgi:hypothetical protein
MFAKGTERTLRTAGLLAGGPDFFFYDDNFSACLGRPKSRDGAHDASSDDYNVRGLRQKITVTHQDNPCTN